MKELRLVLNNRLNQLQSESELIDEAIQEIHRRFRVLDDVESWGLLPEADEISPEYEFNSREVVEEAAEQVTAEHEDEFQFAVSGETAAE